MSYSQPTVSATYTINSGDLSSAVVNRYVQGPPGMKGRLVAASAEVTTTIDSTPDITINFGNDDTSADATYGTMTVDNAATAGTCVAALTVQDGEIVADDPMQVSLSQATTAGAITVQFTVHWF